MSTEPKLEPVAKPEWELKHEGDRVFAQRGHETVNIRGDLSAAQAIKLVARMNAED